MTFKSLENSGPQYMADLLQVHVPGRALRSAHQRLLTVPLSRTKQYGSKAFSVAAPTIWNSLPDDIRKSRSIDAFKSKLKTFLFKQHYGLF
jgi:hypothetical protein